MALCTRCGQQTADGMEFCAVCGSHSGPDGPGEPATVRAMTDNADYLRPFAAEEPAYPALSDHAPVASPAPWPAPSPPPGNTPPSGYLPEYLPPPYDSAGQHDPLDGYLPAPEQAAPAGQAYSLRGPFTPPTVPPPQGDVLAAGSAADLSRSYPAQDWYDYAYPGQPVPASQPVPARQPVPAHQAWPAGQPVPPRQAWPASQPLPAHQPRPASQPVPPRQPEPPSQPVPGDQPPTATLPATDGAGAVPVWHRSRPRWTTSATGRTVGRDGLEIAASKPVRDDGVAGDAVPARGTGLAGEADPSVPGASRRRGWTGRPRGGRWISAAAAAGVVIIATAAVVILLNHGRPAPSAGRGSTPGSGAPGQQRQPTAAPKASSGPLTVTPAAAAGPDAKAVARLVTRYFRAINNHDFALYRTLFSASLRGGLSSAAFARGYGTSRDSLATLQGITRSGAGELNAAVSFTSHQQSADTPSHSACTTWRISLYLARQGHGYVIVSPPAGYKASFGTCS
jgi:hypothetical protein